MQLRDETRSTVVVSAVRLRSVVVLATHFGPSSLQIGVRPGSELSLTASAQGRVAIVFSRKPLLAHAKRLERPPLTPRTITDWTELEAVFRRVGERGWADAPEEMTLGLNVVAAPIFDDTADCVGTIALIGSIQHLPSDPDRAVIEALLGAAERISIKLGYVSHATRSPATPSRSSERRSTR
jgi:DNA-binding IclR family transcriptional regulator